MLGTLKLKLLLGPVPMPAPSDVVEALSAVKVDSGSADAQSGFELTFEVPIGSKIRKLFLGTALGGVPFMRVILIVTLNGRAEPIIDGFATNIEAQPTESGVAKLIVKGKDLSAI